MSIKKQIIHYFDSSSDKDLLREDILKLVETNIAKIKNLKPSCDDPTTYGLLYGDGFCDGVEQILCLILDEEKEK